jgi:hypothetical protein
MFNQYAKGYVKEHSVGMRYVKIELAVNLIQSMQEEKAVWEYIDEIVNKESRRTKLFFSAAKAIEGKRSQRVKLCYPTISIEAVKDTSSETKTSRQSLKQRSKEEETFNLKHKSMFKCKFRQ